MHRIWTSYPQVSKSYPQFVDNFCVGKEGFLGTGRLNIHICTQSYPQLWITRKKLSTEGREKWKANFIKKTGEFVRILGAAGRVRGDLLLGGKNARRPAEVIHKSTRCIHGLWINHGSLAWKKAIGRGNIHICTQSYPQLWITTCPFSTKFAMASAAKFFWCWGQGH